MAPAGDAGAGGLDGTVDLIETIEPESCVTIVLRDSEARVKLPTNMAGAATERPLDSARGRNASKFAFLPARPRGLANSDADRRSRPRPAVRCREREGSVMHDGPSILSHRVRRGEGRGNRSDNRYETSEIRKAHALDPENAQSRRCRQ